MNCFACGVYSEKWAYGDPVDEHLAHTWGISEGIKRLFNYREGTLCPSCGISLRAIGLAHGITGQFTPDAKNFSSFVSFANKNKLKVAEINSCHQLHKQLKKIKGLILAEYGEEKKSENIEALSYKDNSFDLVLHSETLEHVSDPYKAIEE
jgi:hypothetical protein